MGTSTSTYEHLSKEEEGAVPAQRAAVYLLSPRGTATSATASPSGMLCSAIAHVVTAPYIYTHIYIDTYIDNINII